jgi:hypothetical protein
VDGSFYQAYDNAGHEYTAELKPGGTFKKMETSNTISFTVWIGKFERIENDIAYYGEGDSFLCPNGIARKGTISFKEDCSKPNGSATVTEPSKCFYEMVVWMCSSPWSTPNGPLIELLDHDPTNHRQHFRITNDGKLVSSICTTDKSGKEMFVSAESNMCTGGSLLWLEAESSSSVQKWKMGSDGSIALNYDCSKYKAGSLAITAIEDNDIDSMIEKVYVSIFNPSSEMALSAEGSGCNCGGKVTIQKYDARNSNQKFKLINSDGGILIQSQSCIGYAGNVLSVKDCTSQNTEVRFNLFILHLYLIVIILPLHKLSVLQVILGPREFCIWVITGGYNNADGFINVYVDSGNGYTLENDPNIKYDKTSTVLKKCFAEFEGLQVKGTSDDGYV